MTASLCFILMPFGDKSDKTGRLIKFDKVYESIIEPAVKGADLEPLRADEEQLGGIIHKALFERLLLCPYAIADLSTANANVYYELGIRHSARPFSTVLIHCHGEQLPFDLAPDRCLRYAINRQGIPDNPETYRNALTKKLYEVVGRDEPDSPLHQVIDWVQPQILAHQKTDTFRDQVRYSQKVKDELAEARKDGIEAVHKIEDELGDLKLVESGILIDLLLSYRALKSLNDMIRLVEMFPEPTKRTVMVQEQYALALNRAGRGEKAESVLLRLIEERGASSDTYGILGRVYKDRWEKVAENNSNGPFLTGLLDKAIETYLKGFEADFRDAYPGVNAVTLMDIRQPPDSRKDKLLPVVHYAVERKMAAGQPDY